MLKLTKSQKEELVKMVDDMKIILRAKSEYYMGEFIHHIVDLKDNCVNEKLDEVIKKINEL